MNIPKIGDAGAPPLAIGIVAELQSTFTSNIASQLPRNAVGFVYQ